MFGGALAAATVRAARAALGRELELADALFAFLAPTPPGAAVIEVTPHRAGRRRASVSVSIRSGGVTTVQGMLALTTPASYEGRRPASGPPQGTATHQAFSGTTEWLPVSAHAGQFEAWIRATGEAASLPADEWTCIAADLIGPALIADQADPFTIATTSLSITMLAPADPSQWQRQSVTASRHDDVATGELSLLDGTGRVIARAHQQAVLLAADESDLPRGITAFADSSLGSLLIGMN